MCDTKTDSDIPDVVRKALYAGFEYLKHTQKVVREAQQGNASEPFQPDDTARLVESFHDWSTYTQEAIKLLDSQKADGE